VSRVTASKPSRQRLDQLLVDRGFADSRTRAQALVLAGKVRVGEGDTARTDRKPGDQVDVTTPLSVATPEPYVSRGGHKLAAALDAFSVDAAGRIALDVGASTGGFTDVLLQRGARRVYAIDVGRGQLAERLRSDGRVVARERLNARTLDTDTLPEPIELAVVDVSFISLGLVLAPIASTFGRNPVEIIALVKPQFEVGRGQTDHGVVRDPHAHRAVLERVVEQAQVAALATRDVIASPILGPEGNREFLVHLAAGTTAPDIANRIVSVTGA
jgi:23S rRNA (cytidine1920-2'-O)/16S rRNA (cytidine1409-2'-O)-methyltransferase